jgi:F0F1-type ATP synthase membrane subunit c/vacuolar-type H+-ATPase subunit K
MTKSTVTRLFVGSLIAIVAGLILLATGLFVGYANGAFEMSGPDVSGIRSTPFAWSMVGLGLLGVLAIVGGGIGQFVAWIGAVLNTSRLEDKTWFVLLLVLGLLSFGFVPMVIYLFIGPDGTTTRSNRGELAR